MINRTQQKKGQADVHEVPDSGAGKGIPLQQVPDQEKEDRNIPPIVSHRETGKWPFICI